MKKLLFFSLILAYQPFNFCPTPCGSIGNSGGVARNYDGYWASAFEHTSSRVRHPERKYFLSLLLFPTFPVSIPWSIGMDVESWRKSLAVDNAIKNGLPVPVKYASNKRHQRTHHLDSAVMFKNLEALELLLRYQGYRDRLNKPSYGLTPLLHASDWQAGFGLMLDNGACATVTLDNKSGTVVKRIIDKDNKEAFEALLDKTPSIVDDQRAYIDKSCAKKIKASLKDFDNCHFTSISNDML